VRLVDDLLDVSRITRGKVTLEREPIELSGVVAKAVEMATPLIAQQGHQLTVDVPATGLRVLGDPTRLAQVVANLLNNAARYSAAGGQIEVRAGLERDEVVLSVRDNGRGISADLLPRIFDQFVQGPRSTDRQEGGLGLGLALVRSLVELHGGRVEAYSDGPLLGSTFRVRLPALAAAPHTAKAKTPPEAEGRAPRPMRVLVVDDNVDAANLVDALLCARGHEVVTAYDGPSALAALDRFTPDVAVLDIGLPAMDGYELAARTRERLGDASPRLLALTGYGADGDRARSRAAGFDEHLVKPVNPAALRAAVEGVAN
jgi:CheY-like chemotaxis protein